MVPLDSVLVVFNAQEFKRVVQADPNRSNDPLITALTQAELSELYLNGDKIAFMPPTQGKTFGNTIRPFYRLTPAVNLDLAIIERADGVAQSMSLRGLLQSQSNFSLLPGDKIHLFENQFLLTEVTKLGEDAGAQRAANWRELSDLFSRAQVRKLLIDDQVRALFPRQEAFSIASIIDTLGFETVDRFSDLIILERQSSDMRLTTEISSAAGDISLPLAQDVRSVSFYTPDGKAALLEAKNSKKYDQVQARGMSLFIDYALVDIGIPEDFLESESELTDQITSPALYPLFAIYEFFDENQGFWVRKAISLADLKSEQFLVSVTPGARVSAFTRHFIDELLNSGSGSGSDANQQLLGLQASGLETSGDEEQMSEKMHYSELMANAGAIDTNTETMSPNVQLFVCIMYGWFCEKPGYPSPIQYRSHNYFQRLGFDRERDIEPRNFIRKFWMEKLLRIRLHG